MIFILLLFLIYFSFLSGVYRADIHLYAAEEGDGSKRSQKSYFSPE
jgi:hypothetical protein